MDKLRLKSQPTLQDFQRYVADMVVARGFQQENLAQKFMLLIEELGELAKTARKAAGGKVDITYKPGESAHEAADVFVLLLDICNLLNIDLEKAFREKEAKNRLRTWQ